MLGSHEIAQSNPRNQYESFPLFGGRKVVDQLLIDISTGDSSVVGSQSSTRDNMQTIDSGKSVSRKKLTNETIAKTTTNRSASSTANGQSADVLKGLNELKDLQR